MDLCCATQSTAEFTTEALVVLLVADDGEMPLAFLPKVSRREVWTRPRAYDISRTKSAPGALPRQISKATSHTIYSRSSDESDYITMADDGGQQETKAIC